MKVIVSIITFIITFCACLYGWNELFTFILATIPASAGVNDWLGLFRIILWLFLGGAALGTSVLVGSLVSGFVFMLLHK